MFISKDFVFVHIPRTAGISFTNYCKNNFERDKSAYSWFNQRININNEEYKILASKNEKLSRFNTFKDIDITHYTSKEILKNHRKLINKEFISIVRNPWDWHVSIYSFFKSHMINVFGFKIKSFDDYINFIDNFQYTTTIDNLLLKYFTYNQYDWLTDWKNDLVVNRVMKFENLCQDFQSFQIDYNLIGDLKKENSSNHKDYKKFYNDKTKDIIYRRHKVDINKFNYEFD